MNNFEFEHEGKKYWYSRSMATVGIVISYDENGNRYVLAIKEAKELQTIKVNGVYLVVILILTKR